MTFCNKSCYFFLSEAYAVAILHNDVHSHSVSSNFDIAAKLFLGFIAESDHCSFRTLTCKNSDSLLTCTYFDLRPLFQYIWKCTYMVIVRMRKKNIIQCSVLAVENLMYVCYKSVFKTCHSAVVKSCFFSAQYQYRLSASAACYPCQRLGHIKWVFITHFFFPQYIEKIYCYHCYNNKSKITLYGKHISYHIFKAHKTQQKCRCCGDYHHSALVRTFFYFSSETIKIAGS